MRDTVRLSAIVDPERASQSVSFQRRIGASGAWTDVGTDTSSPAYVSTDDISGLGLGEGDALQYRAVLTEADGNEVFSRIRTVRAAPTPVTTAVVHYERTDGDYDGWGLHLFGEAEADAVLAQVRWDRPWPYTSVDADGARFEIALKDDRRPVKFIVHLPSGDQVPETREPGGDRSFIPLDHPEIWLRQGDPRVYYEPPPEGR